MREHHDQQDPARIVAAPHPERSGAPSHDHRLDLASTLGNANLGQVLNTPAVQRAGATDEQQLDESVARTIEERRGRGAPLDDRTRTEMEGALGHDLSDVRVHTDRTAHQLNEAVSARAFTTGNDVFFTQGTYDPGSSSGKELLGHELAHVAQQRAGTSGLAAGEVSHPSDPAEQQAAAAGAAIAAGSSPVADTRPATAGVAREEEEEELQLATDHTVQREEDEEYEEYEEELPGG